VPNAICACESSEETPEHIFWQCQRSTKKRKKPTKGLLKRWDTLLLNGDMILASTDPSEVYVLGAFLIGIKVIIVTDLINALPVNSSVNTVQRAKIEEPLFSVDPTDAPIDWLDSDHVMCVYCRSMSVPLLYK
jgi:hypothetical protein